MPAPNEAPKEENVAAEELVSVVIPCYNQAHFLSEAIQSVLSQTYTDFEVVVVDDGSKDDTAQVSAGYAAKDSRVRLIEQENRGLAGARNRGLAESHGQYVAFLDSDDRLLEEALEVGVRELEAHPGCAFVSGRYRPIDADGETYSVPRQARVGGDHYLALLRDNYISMPALVMYRRWVFDEVGDFDGSVDAAADWDLYLRVARRFPIYHHGEVVADYRWHGSNMTADPALMLRSTVSVLRGQRKYVEGNKGYEEAYEEGIGLFREHNGMNLAKEVRSLVRRRDPRRALSGALVLARYYPRGLGFVFGEGRLQRYELAEQLEAREKRLKNRERKLRVANKRLEELDGALTKEKRRGKRLRRRNRDLALEVQVLGRQPEHPHDSATSFRRTTFFVVGEMKSGTSWVMWMLDSHPEVFCSGEGCFFGRHQETEDIPVILDPTPSLRNGLLGCEGLRIWRSFMWNYWGKQGDAEEDLRNLTRLAVDYYMLQGSAQSGKRIVGDKSPLHTDHVDEIFELYPKAKVIHVVRDGRDVAVSLMHHFWNLSKDAHAEGIYDLEPEELAKRDAYRKDPEAFLASGQSIFVEERLRQMAVRWNRRTGKASREGTELFGENFLQLRYEDLLLSPEESMQSAFELLGANSDADTVSRCVQNNSFERTTGRPRGTEESESFFRKGVAGDWRTPFTQRDREVYEQVAGRTLVEMGYSLD
ncbi:MAG: glycosyltransferase [Actinomycetota bacterium]|nr:glycosyltransferase [Actinomycetota bacterium]